MAVVDFETVASFEDACELIDAGFDALSARSDFTVDVEVLEQRAVAAVRVAERAKAAAAAAVAEADRCGVPVRNNVRSMSILLARSTGGPAEELAPYKTLGLWVDAFPAVRDAWQRGEITDAHVRHLKTLHNRRTDQFFRRDQDMLVGHARMLLWDKFQTDCNYWLLHADPDGQLPTSRDLSYGVKTKTLANGDVELHGRFDPITGEAFLNAFDHEDQKLFRQTRDNPDAHPQLAAMSHRRRRLVALMNLISRGFERQDGSHPIPLINIVMSQKVAEDLINRTTGDPDGSFDPHSLPLDPDDIDRRCETIRGTPLDPRRLWPLLLIGQLRRQIFKPNGRTAEYSSGTRMFTAAQKNALLVEARGHCSTPGCDNPWIMLTADHTQPWSLTKHTCIADGTIKCDPCNSWKSNIPGRT